MATSSSRWRVLPWGLIPVLAWLGAAALDYIPVGGGDNVRPRKRTDAPTAMWVTSFGNGMCVGTTRE